jgi:RNA polymerase sigma-70 factor (ECF subfamily)
MGVGVPAPCSPVPASAVTVDRAVTEIDLEGLKRARIAISWRRHANRGSNSPDVLNPRAPRRLGHWTSRHAPPTPPDDLALLDRLRAGDERAFIELVGRHHDAMLRLARAYVPNLAVAEEVVQETWLVVLRGVAGFEGRSSMKTWLYRILVNRARTTGAREHRHVPIGDPEQAVDPSRFDRDGSWVSPPDHWVDDVVDRVRAGKLSGSIRSALDELPLLQRDVVTLRDVEGMSSAEACQILGISDSNQRVLLHRGRSRLRHALEAEFGKV